MIRVEHALWCYEAFKGRQRAIESKTVVEWNNSNPYASAFCLQLDLDRDG